MLIFTCFIKYQTVIYAVESPFKPAEIPENIQKMEDINEIISLLNDRNYRYAAIRRLGQIGGDQTIKVLSELIKSDKQKAMKKEAINALKENGSIEVKDALLDILNIYIPKGKEFKTKKSRYSNEYRDFRAVTIYSLDALEKWSNEEDVSILCLKLFDDKEYRSAYRKFAFKVYFLGEVSKKRIEKLEDKIDYIIEQMPGRDEENKNIEDRIKTNAMYDILVDYGSVAVNHLKQVLQNMQKQDIKYKTIESAIRTIGNLEEIKQKEKMKSEQNYREL